MIRYLLIFSLLLALPAQAAETKAMVLYYRLIEPGIDPYLSRWLVTDRYLRIDEGDATDNFILFDRQRKTVYSIVHGDRTILEIPHRAVTKTAPIALRHESRVVDADKLPAIDGQQPLYRELYVNGALCYSVVSVQHLLPEAVALIGEYREVMAGEHAKNMDNTPAELQQPCDLVQHIFNPLWPVAKGLPIQAWDAQGKGQTLLDYKSGEAVDGALFRLPDGYRLYQTE